MVVSISGRQVQAGAIELAQLTQAFLSEFKVTQGKGFREIVQFTVALLSTKGGQALRISQEILFEFIVHELIVMFCEGVHAGDSMQPEKVSAHAP